MERELFTKLERWMKKKNRKPLIIQGARQVGKTWIMKSLIKAAAERQYRCRYVKTRDLMEDIAIAVDEKRFSRLADQLDRYDLIGLDDFNLLKAKDEVREAMLELFDRRWNKRGLIISSQYPFDQWYEYIGGRGDQRDAMMDRIANGSHRLELKGPSMREKREKVMKEKLCFS